MFSFGEISIYEDVARKIKGYIASLELGDSALETQLLKQLFLADPSSPDYNHLAYAFAKSFLIPNYWKMAGLLSKEVPRLSLHIIDAGSGSGAASLAYLASIESRLAMSEVRLQITVTLIDRSLRQLELAKGLLDHVAQEFKHLRIRVRPVVADLFLSVSSNQNADCVLLSHVLTENRSYVEEILQNVANLLGGCGSLHIVERIDDSVWAEIDKAAVRMALPLTSGSMALPDVKPAFITEHPVSFPLRLRYMTMRAPREKCLPLLVQRYFLAWEQQSLSTLAEVFSVDAEYLEKPFSTQLKGLAQIEEYWRSVVLPQVNPRVSILGIAYNDLEAFVEWRASHGSLKVKIIRGIMVLTLDPATQKIIRLREYFRTTEGTSES